MPPGKPGLLMERLIGSIQWKLKALKANVQQAQIAKLKVDMDELETEGTQAEAETRDTLHANLMGMREKAQLADDALARQLRTLEPLISGTAQDIEERLDLGEEADHAGNAANKAVGEAKTHILAKLHETHRMSHGKPTTGEARGAK